MFAMALRSFSLRIEGKKKKLNKILLVLGMCTVCNIESCKIQVCCCYQQKKNPP